MLTVNKLVPQGQGLASVLLKRAASVELDWDTRQKSRFDATDSGGRHLGVFLPHGSVVRGGDVLVCENGSLIRVNAAVQAVMVVRPCAEHGNAVDLLRAAYRLGNRHAQLELQADHLKLEPDPVLADLLRRMHLIVTEEQAPFEPEASAFPGHEHEYGGEQAHAGRHTHSHPDSHTHGHTHGHTHDHAHPHDQQHGHRRDHR
jgi:urease accessory protein